MCVCRKDNDWEYCEECVPKFGPSTYVEFTGSVTKPLDSYLCITKSMDVSEKLNWIDSALDKLQDEITHLEKLQEFLTERANVVSGG